MSDQSLIDSMIISGDWADETHPVVANPWLKTADNSEKTDKAPKKAKKTRGSRRRKVTPKRSMDLGLAAPGPLVPTEAQLRAVGDPSVPDPESERRCTACTKPIIMTDSNKAYYRSRGMNFPRRCFACIELSRDIGILPRRSTARPVIQL